MQSCVSAQESSSECNLLERCINTPIFASNFLYSEVVSDTIIIVDTNHRIVECGTKVVKGKILQFQSEELPKKRMVKDNSIIVFNATMRDCVLLYSFYSPSTGRVLTYNLLKNGDNSYDVIGYRIGDF